MDIKFNLKYELNLVCRPTQWASPKEYRIASDIDPFEVSYYQDVDCDRYISFWLIYQNRKPILIKHTEENGYSEFVSKEVVKVDEGMGDAKRQYIGYYDNEGCALNGQEIYGDFHLAKKDEVMYLIIDFVEYHNHGGQVQEKDEYSEVYVLPEIDDFILNM